MDVRDGVHYLLFNLLRLLRGLAMLMSIPVYTLALSMKEPACYLRIGLRGPLRVRALVLVR